jgi:hypothetical protein
MDNTLQAHTKDHRLGHNEDGAAGEVGEMEAGPGPTQPPVLPLDPDPFDGLVPVLAATPSGGLSHDWQ